MVFDRPLGTRLDSMGGSKSVPVKETARAVIARNKPQADQSAKLVETVSSPSVPQTRRSHQVEDFMDPNILKEMSSWGGHLKSGTDKKALELRTNNAGKEMASMIRFSQEAQQKDAFGRTPKFIVGKLTEEQITSLFKNTRELTKTPAALAAELQISEDTVSKLLSIARAPILKRKNVTGDAKLNELIVAV